MNIDDFKNSFQSLSYNSDENMNVEFTRKVEGVVEKVRKEDKRDKTLLVAVSILLIGIGILYAIAGIVKYLDNPEGNGSWGYAIYVLGIITVIPYLIYKIRQINHTCYDIPVVKFIANVEKRYALFQLEQLFILPFLVMASIAVCYIFADGKPLTIQSILTAQIPLIIGLTVGLIIGVSLWYRRKKPILEELRSIRKSMEG